MEKYLEINLPSAVMYQLPIFSSTTLVKYLGLCEFYKESKINRFFFSVTIFLIHRDQTFP